MINQSTMTDQPTRTNQSTMTDQSTMTIQPTRTDQSTMTNRLTMINRFTMTQSTMINRFKTTQLKSCLKKPQQEKPEREVKDDTTCFSKINIDCSFFFSELSFSRTIC